MGKRLKQCYAHIGSTIQFFVVSTLLLVVQLIAYIFYTTLRLLRNVRRTAVIA